MACASSRAAGQLSRNRNNDYTAYKLIITQDEERRKAREQMMPAGAPKS